MVAKNGGRRKFCSDNWLPFGRLTDILGNIWNEGHQRDQKLELYCKHIPALPNITEEEDYYESEEGSNTVQKNRSVNFYKRMDNLLPGGTGKFGLSGGINFMTDFITGDPRTDP